MVLYYETIITNSIYYNQSCWLVIATDPIELIRVEIGLILELALRLEGYWLDSKSKSQPKVVSLNH